jgi:ribonuclease P/MRP protein subunit POP1
MAHNSYRIPLRIRYKSLKDMGGKCEAIEEKRSRCRRHRRKLKLLLHLYELRKKNGGAWMESHIWHAKRFKMIKDWGVNYPARCSDKSDRSTYRLSQKESACIMD